MKKTVLLSLLLAASPAFAQPAEAPAETKETAPSADLPSSPAPTWREKLEPAESDWPGYQGPRGNSTTPEVGFLTEWPAGGPPIAWQDNIGIGLSSLAVVEDRVVMTGNDGMDKDTVFCLALKNGKPIWKYHMEATTKIHKMSIVPYGPAATPVVVKDKVYVLSRDGSLVCLSFKTGGELWKTHLVKDLGGKLPVYGYAGSPSVIEGKVYLDIGGEEKSTTCLDANTGKVVWQTGSGEAGYSTPFIVTRGEKKVLITFKGEALELRDPADGKLLASHATTTRDFCNCATPIVAGNFILISHTGNMGARVLEWKEDNTLEERWTDRKFGMLFHSGMQWGENVLAFNDAARGSNDLRLIDLSNGQSRWQSKDIPKGTGLLTDDGHAIFLTNLGEVVLAKVEADKLTILSRAQALPAKAWCQPVLSHGYLFCKNNNGDITCFNLNKAK